MNSSALTASATASATPFTGGDDLKAWLDHFKFRDTFQELGVTIVSDIEILSDYELLDQLKKSSTPLDFKKFLKARELTFPTPAAPEEPLAQSGAKDVRDDLNYDFADDVSRAGDIPPHVEVVNMSEVLSDVSGSVYGEDTASVHSAGGVDAGDGSHKEKSSKASGGSADGGTGDGASQENSVASSLTSASRNSSVKPIGNAPQQVNDEMGKETTKRLKKIDKTISRLRKMKSIDLCFLVDCTGSMKPYLDELTKHIFDLCLSIQNMHPLCTIRLGFVGYRDVMEEQHDNFVVLDFTETWEDFRALVRNQAAAGGGDEAEDVIGGLNKVLYLDWKADNRLLIHIGDAPCHGIKFHGGISSDHFPEGDPKGLQVEDLLAQFMVLNIKYAFARINYKTDQMINQFNLICSNYAKSSRNEKLKEFMDTSYITTLPESEISSMMYFVSQFTAKNYWESASTTASTDSSSSGKDDKDALRQFEYVTFEPDWNSVTEEKVCQYRMMMPATLEELVFAPMDKSVKDFPELELLSVKVAPAPFAKGVEKVAFYARVSEPPTDPASSEGVMIPYVCKELLKAKAKHRTKAKYEIAVSCQRAATMFASLFNSQKPKDCPKIVFADIRIIQLNTRWPEQPYALLEKRLDSAANSKYEKFNNNNGGVVLNPTPHGTNHAAVQAFSHFTYCRSGEQLIVVDCQGIYYEQPEQLFYLTDPVVHCNNIFRFGGTNFGQQGIDMFFRTHVCNSICASLQLLRPNSKPAAAERK